MFELPPPTHSENNYVTAKKALKDVEGAPYNNELLKVNPKTVEMLKLIPPGGNFTAIPKNSPYYVKGMISHVYRRLHPDKPSTTIIAGGGGGLVERGVEPFGLGIDELWQRVHVGALELLHPAPLQDLARQHEFAESRRLLAEALDARDLPPELREVFSRLRVDMAGAEVGQLTATTLREAQRGSAQDVLGLLRQVEDSVRAAGDALPDDRRDEATRRLWLTCTRLAARRLGANDAAEALDWLFRSMVYTGGRPERLAESAASIARALAALVEQCADGIQTAIAAGRHQAARAEAERTVLAHIKKRLSAGLAPFRILSAYRTACRMRSG